MTKKEMLKNIINFVENGNCEASPAELIEFCSHEIELLERKSATPKKPTATQVENESLRAELLSFLVSVDTLKNIKEIQEECSTFAELSNQRMSHLLTALVNDGKVEKTYVKKTPYYCAK